MLSSSKPVKLFRLCLGQLRPMRRNTLLSVSGRVRAGKN